jgi:Spy/CpxP family protein refolding chaperone
MKRSFLNVAGAAVLMAGMALAQNAPVQNSPHTGRHGAAQAGSVVDRLATKLNLTDAQKQQAQSIFAAARKSAQPVRAQIRQDKQALAAAVKSGSQADIDRISNSMGPLLAQASAMHAKAFAQFYAILTPDQKTQMDQQMNRMSSGARRWQGHRNGSPATPPSGE